MGVTAWIVLAIVVAERLIGGPKSHGIIVTCLTGVAGALLGGWLASHALPRHQSAGLVQPLRLDHRVGRCDRPARRGTPGGGRAWWPAQRMPMGRRTVGRMSTHGVRICR